MNKMNDLEIWDRADVILNEIQEFESRYTKQLGNIGFEFIVNI